SEVAGTLRVPSSLLRHTECAYYFLRSVVWIAFNGCRSTASAFSVSRFGTAHRRPCLRGAMLLVVCLALSSVAKAEDEAADEAKLGAGVSLTIYNQNFAVVKERRLMTFDAGVGLARFGDVAATIVPESVQFSALDPKSPVNVLEQNYEFDLVSADKLLNKYVDKKITVVTRDGGLIEGTLLSSDANQLVLADRNGIDLVP